MVPALRGALAENRSAAETAGLLRQVGYAFGAALEPEFTRWLGEQERAPAVELPASEFWQALNEFFQASGWGSLRHSQLHPGVAVLDSPDWIEAENPGEMPVFGCHLAEGIFADVLGRVAGAPIAVLEVECRSRGAERCRHLFGGQAALDAVFGNMQAGHSYSEAVSRLES